MAYNYDANPWDDENQTNYPSQYQQQASGPTSTAYSATGYSNPSSQYEAHSAWNKSAQQDQFNPYVEPQAPLEDSYQQQQQQQQLPLDQSAGKQQQDSSALARFLRAHVPICGACMDSTKPITDILFKYVNRNLLASKIFYFFFYSAFGSLFPLMGVYFKQLGMNPAQVGLLTGVRPFIEIFSAPFWNSLAERFKKSKVILLFSLLSWIVFTYSLAHIRPPASACIAFNDTDYVLYTPYSANDLSNYDVGQLDSTLESKSETANIGGDGQLAAADSEKKTNEVLMKKMPKQEQTGSLNENKDEILINEENVNDQGRRRRKRSYIATPFEQISKPTKLTRFSYESDKSFQDNIEDRSSSLAAHPFEFAIDLESDFEDTPINREGKMESASSSSFNPTVADRSALFFENPDPVDSITDYKDELEQQEAAVPLRFKRSLTFARERNENDEFPGEEESSSGGHNRGDERPDEEEGGDTKEKSHAVGEGNESGEELSSKEEEERERDRDEVKHEHRQHSTLSQPPLMGASSTGNTNEKQQVEIESQGMNKTKRIYKQRHKTPPTHIVGMSPITVEYAVNYNKEKHGQFVTPMFSTIVYKLDHIKEVFFLLLLLISLGEFFSAPAITIADSTTLNCLGENTDLYGRQRMFGSIGWAITLLLVGMALDNSTRIADHPCGPHQRERSYTVCFTIFSLLMGCAFITATQFTFNYGPKTGAGEAAKNQVVVAKAYDNTVITTTVGGANTPTNVDELYASTRPREIFNTAPPVNAPPPGSQQGAKEKFEFLDKWKSAVFAQSTWELPEWVGVFSQFRNTMHLTYLFITWFLGCGVGLVFTFLFWHLQDVGGTRTLFGICSVINHISEILAYFFSSYFIKRFGHTKVLSVGLGCNVIRFLYVAFLSNPYYALPFELVQGITHAACFAACCSYMSHVSKPELKASTQGVMQGLHNGIGRACGAILGGYLINAIGSRASFCIYGLLSGCVLGGFLYVRKKASEHEEVKVDDVENLGDLGAPQGVPSALPTKMAQNAQPQEIDYQW